MSLTPEETALDLQHTSYLIDQILGASDARTTAETLVRSRLQVSEEPLTAMRDMLGSLSEPLRSALHTDAAWSAVVALCDLSFQQFDPERVFGVIGDWLRDEEIGALVNETRLHRLANRMAWPTRGARALSLQHLDINEPVDRLRMMIEFERARFMFSFERITNAVAELPAEWSSHVFVRAMDLFAKVNVDLEPKTRLESVEQLWNVVADHPLRSAVSDILLHAVWLCYRLDDGGECLHALSTYAIAERRVDEPIARFRRAAARRDKGDWDGAIADLTSALAQLKGATEFTRTFSEQIIREREFVIRARSTAQALEETSRELAAFKQDMQTETAAFREDVRDIERSSLSRTIEIVTLFTAAIAFTIGSLSVISQGDGSTSDRIALVLGLSVGLLSFSILTVGVLIVTTARDSEGKSRAVVATWSRLAVVIGIVIAIQCVALYLVATA